MKVSLQTILNVCFAISLSALVYQNNQLNNSIDTLKGYAQLDTDKAWERMDSIEDKIKINYSNFEKQDAYNRELQEVIAENQVNIDRIVDTVNDHAEGLNVVNGNVDKLIKFLDSVYGERDNP